MLFFYSVCRCLLVISMLVLVVFIVLVLCIGICGGMVVLKVGMRKWLVCCLVCSLVVCMKWLWCEMLLFLKCSVCMKLLLLN